jgi:hypothetical protein
LEEDDLLKVITLLSREGTHRVAVIDILSDIRSIITQTDIARFLLPPLRSLKFKNRKNLTILKFELQNNCSSSISFSYQSN